MTRIILVRHGQTEWNRVERFRGLKDIELDETGHRQAQAIADRLHRWEIHAIYSSPLKRAFQTAQPIAEAKGLEVQPLQGLNDIDYGAWTGLSPEEVATEYGVLYQILLDNPHLAQLPDGESLDQVRIRAVDALKRICLRQQSGTVVLVSHQVVNRVLLCAILGLSNASFWQIAQDNAAINIFEAQGGKYRLLLLNDTCHLESLSSELPPS
jgi:broad specificity phosphatase PhoE